MREATNTRRSLARTATVLGWRTVGKLRRRSGWSPPRSSTSLVAGRERDPHAVAGRVGGDPVRRAGQLDPADPLQARLRGVDDHRVAAGVGDVDAPVGVGHRVGRADARVARPLALQRARVEQLDRVREHRDHADLGRRRRRRRRAVRRRSRRRRRGRPGRAVSVEENSSPTNTRPPSPAASCGWSPTRVTRFPPSGRDTSTSSSAGSAGTSTGPPGAASCRWRGGPAAARACGECRRGRAARATAAR